MGALLVYRLKQFSPVFIGQLTSASFTYDASYLRAPDATPLSRSLPLSEQPFSPAHYRPYFEGLLAEGAARQALAASLQLPEDDWLGILAACGRECIGDVIVSPEKLEQGRLDGSYAPVELEKLSSAFREMPATASDNAEMRLSLAGAQNKTGLAHVPSSPVYEGWLRPSGFAATTHILKTSHLRDLPELEFICMKAAMRCGIPTARVELLNLGTPVLAVERFDRAVHGAGANDLEAERLHQEDLSQALGVTPASKYAELEGGSISSIAKLLRTDALQPARDLASFAKMLCFAYVVGDCDAHLKNFSILYPEKATPGKQHFKLAPAYDLVSTSYFPRFSRDMAMAYGGIRDIDAIAPETFETLAREIGITKQALIRLAQPIVDSIEDAISGAGGGDFGAVLESTPYIAEDLLEDIAPRLEVLSAFCSE